MTHLNLERKHPAEQLAKNAAKLVWTGTRYRGGHSDDRLSKISPFSAKPDLIDSARSKIGSPQD